MLAADPDDARKSLTSRARWSAAAVAVAVLIQAGDARASAVDLYYERAVMSAAGQNCGLFTPDLAAALASAQAQARGAALRSGVADEALHEVALRARRRADDTACASPDIAKAASRVRAAFESYSRLQKLNFPGDSASWAADRAVSRDVMRWKLWQTADLGAQRLTFGLAGVGGQSGLVAVAGLERGAAWPYGARLVVRDVTRAPRAFLNLISAGASGRPTLSGRMPPRAATLSILAQARGPADASLLPPGADQGVAFRFPASAADTLSALDPRETVAVELLFADPAGREETRAAYIEVGDFAAGRAFLGAAQR
jgi:hypothetical protein